MQGECTTAVQADLLKCFDQVLGSSAWIKCVKEGAEGEGGGGGEGERAGCKV